MDTGFFGIYAAVNPDNAYQTVRLIYDEIHDLASHPVSETELAEAKEYIKGNLLLASESTDNQMVRLAQNEINFGYHISLEEIVARIAAVDREEVRTLAQNLFRNHPLSLTSLGPLTDRTPLESVFQNDENKNSEKPTSH
jgi:predicted Zn-dependent peptidase